MSKDQKPQPKKQQKQRRMGLEISKDLEAVYANAALISNTPAEIVVDFVQVLPRMPKGKVKSRVILSPMHAKLLLKALNQNVANYERQFGEIRVPQQPNLADEFFKFSKDDDKDGDKDGDK